MKNGAIILAAGKSSRMGAFKPLLKIGNRAMIEHIISSLQEANCEEIVIVTGRESIRLREYVNTHCKGNISFADNLRYQTNEMIDSVKIGLQKISSERIFITTADIPLFSVTTLQGMLELSADIIKPSYQGKCGHPILISAAIKQNIMQYQGQGGLKGALMETQMKVSFYETNDVGILLDADDQEEFLKLKEMYENRS